MGTKEEDLEDQNGDSDVFVVTKENRHVCSQAC